MRIFMQALFFLPILPPRSAEPLTLSFLANAMTHTLCPSSIPLHNPSMGAAPATSFRGPPSRVYVYVFERENTPVNAMRLCRPAVLSRAHSHTPGCLSLRNSEYQLDFVCVLVFGQPRFQCESGVYVCCCEHRALVIQVPPYNTPSSPFNHMRFAQFHLDASFRPFFFQNSRFSSKRWCCHRLRGWHCARCGVRLRGT